MAGPSCTIEVTNGLDQLTTVQDALEDFVQNSGLDDDVRHTLLLVVEELFVNTVHYGYEEAEPDTIAISVGLRQNGDVHLTICDQARPFDASQPPRVPSGEESLEDIQIGGLGLFLVHELARQILHRRQGNSNITEVILPGVGTVA
ncbi:ATP-binding protein [Ciceribacter sp. L1K23]|uniref:ATP-binding protein n=1 Tax=unclassified Ciceribacter TaxID=2628820 RepID=UPI001ABE40A9|nr:MULTISPECIES: ATP-binding protein [unclassified Ciceribacter]MBO3761690.1 ATP-binding protein [Ciceribacter sp. L1K22]MBR0558404.1 ATP-binding protein [Ciceribacter sp. L1K23]